MTDLFSRPNIPQPLRSTPILWAATLLWSASCFADSSSARHARIPVSDAARKVAEPEGIDPSLPNVLLIGNSNSIGYATTVRAGLQGEANVFHIPDNARTTAYGLENLNDWLGDRNWDTIVFSWGSWDSILTPLPEYERNLTKIVEQLKSTGAQLLFANLTPAPEVLTSYGGTRLNYNETVSSYNAAAIKVMTKEEVPVVGLYALVVEHLEDYQYPRDYRFAPSGYRKMGQAILYAIRHPESAERLPHAPKHEFFMAIFSFQAGKANPPQKAHTFAAFVKLNDRRQILDEVTISWGPANGFVQPMRVRPQEGVNMTLKESFDEAVRVGSTISMWGPYQIQPELFRRAEARSRELESGRIKYVVFDLRWRYYGTACMCIHAVSDIVGHLKTARKRGDAASAAVARHLAPWVINATVPGDRSIASALGVNRYRIIRRKTPLRAASR